MREGISKMIGIAITAITAILSTILGIAIAAILSTILGGRNI